jgi:hypothetical protein
MNAEENISQQKVIRSQHHRLFSQAVLRELETSLTSILIIMISHHPLNCYDV